MFNSKNYTKREELHVSIDWNALRIWDGSQHTAFEELCCQLARHEDIPHRSDFVRKGTPDAGVECYWKLENGEEWGWQSKFFTKTPEATQCKELDESVTTVLRKHPKLKKYYVSDKPTWGRDYEFNAPCYLKFVIPFSSYEEKNIIWLFNHTIEYGESKGHPIFGEFEFDYAPFSTLDELNYLYDTSIKNIEDNLAYLSDPNFVQTINKYKENSEHINELTKANEDLKNKACTILLKKAVISNEFEEK